MRKGKGRRMNPTSGYIGSGNKTNYFTHRPKYPFSRMKKIYGEELERFELSHSPSESNFEKLLAQKKREIREKITGEIIREKRQNIFIIISLIALIITLATVVDYYLPRFL